MDLNRRYDPVSHRGMDVFSGVWRRQAAAQMMTLALVFAGLFTAKIVFLAYMSWTGQI